MCFWKERVRSDCLLICGRKEIYFVWCILFLNMMFYMLIFFNLLVFVWYGFFLSIVKLVFFLGVIDLILFFIFKMKVVLMVIEWSVLCSDMCFCVVMRLFFMFF